MRDAKRPLLRVTAGAIRIASAVALAWLLLAQLDWQAIRESWHGRYWLALLAAQPVLLFAISLVGLRHASVVRTPPIAWVAATKAVVLSSGLNLVLPGRIAEAIKATYLRERCNVELSAALAAVVFERLGDLLIVSLFAFGVLLLGWGNPLVLAAGLAASLAFILALPLFERWGAPILARFPNATVRNLGTAMLRSLTNVSRHRSSFRFWATSLTIWSASYANIVVLLLAATQGESTLLLAAKVFLAGTFGLAIPLLPGGIGTFEAAIVFVLRLEGFATADAIGLSLLLRLNQLAIPGVGSLILLMTERLGIAKLIADLRSETSDAGKDTPV